MKIFHYRDAEYALLNIKLQFSKGVDRNVYQMVPASSAKNMKKEVPGIYRNALQ